MASPEWPRSLTDEAIHSTIVVGESLMRHLMKSALHPACPETLRSAPPSRRPEPRTPAETATHVQDALPTVEMR